MTPWEVVKYSFAVAIGSAFILGALLYVPGVIMRASGVCQ